MSFKLHTLTHMFTRKLLFINHHLLAFLRFRVDRLGDVSCDAMGDDWNASSSVVDAGGLLARAEDDVANPLVGLTTFSLVLDLVPLAGDSSVVVVVVVDGCCVEL